MKIRNFLPILFVVGACLSWGQSVSSGQQSSSGTQTGTPAAPTTANAQRRAQMRAMCKEHIAAMKTDVEKMHSAFDKMKANVASISNAEEKARWQANVDMWQTVMGHHERMLKQMEAMQGQGMGCGMMMGGMGMGGGMGRGGMGPMSPPSAAPADTKPQ